MDEQQERIRGADAARILDEPLLKEAFATIEQNIVNKLATTSTPDPERVQLSYLLAAGRAYQRYLKQTMETGKMAEVAFEQKQRGVLDIFRRSA